MRGTFARKEEEPEEPVKDPEPVEEPVKPTP